MMVGITGAVVRSGATIHSGVSITSASVDSVSTMASDAGSCYPLFFSSGRQTSALTHRRSLGSIS